MLVISICHMLDGDNIFQGLIPKWQPHVSVVSRMRTTEAQVINIFILHF